MGAVLGQSKMYEELNCQVVLVAHAPRENALSWLEESKVDFPLLVDENRLLYRQLGLRRVVKGLVYPSTLTFFVEQELAGNRLASPEKGDDTLDMGGDFITNDKGDLLYCFCQTTFERKPLSDVLAVIQPETQ